MAKDVKIISIALTLILVLSGGIAFMEKGIGIKGVMAKEPIVADKGKADPSVIKGNEKDLLGKGDGNKEDDYDRDNKTEEEDDIKLVDSTKENTGKKGISTKPEEKSSLVKKGGSGPKRPVKPTPVKPVDPGGWVLVWNDEFDGKGTNLNANGIDLDKWGFQTGTGSQYGLVDWGNNEAQYYREENARVEDGKLIIEAKKESYGGKSYTSSRLYTKPNFSKKYGRFVAKIKLPEGQGFWPAFWMMPQDDVYGGWAASGEIDIMEAKGRFPTEASGAIHYGGQWPNNTYSGGSYTFPEGQTIGDFHEYAIEWKPGEIRWYIDGKLYNTLNNWYTQGENQATKYSYPAPFDQEFYMILNLAIGGHFDGGRLPDDDNLPNRMEVEYVRVYESKKPYKEVKEPITEKEELPEDSKRPLEDGNLVYDNQFLKPFNIIDDNGKEWNTLYWNFVTLPDFGGKGSISLENIGSTDFAKIDIADPGNQSYSIQLIQNVTLGKGRAYRVSFDAKSTDRRNINVKLCGDESRGWATYSKDESIALTDSIKSYDFVFNMTHGTDPRARLEFNMGLNNSSVWIGNVRVEEVESLFDEDGPKKPLSNGNHVYNGTFDQGRVDRMTFWSLSLDGAKAKARVDEGTRELTVDIKNPGNKPQAVKVVQKGMNLIKDNDYKVTFKARATKPRPIDIDITNKDGSITYSGQQSINLTTSMNEYSLTFKMDNDNDIEGVFNFLLGKYRGDVYIDDVVMTRETNIIDYTGVTIYPLENGDFSDGMDCWTPYVIEGGGGNISVQDNKAKIAITSVGGASHTIMLAQENMPFSKNVEYELSFDARSSKDRNIEAVIDNSSYTRRFSEKVNLTSEKQTFSFTFKMNVDEVVNLKFLMGNIDGSDTLGAHDIFIENVVLQVKDAPVKRPPRLYADKTDNVLGKDIEISFMDDKEWKDAIKAIKLNGQVLQGDGYRLEEGKLTLLANNFPKTGSYTILVEADGYAEARANQDIVKGDGTDPDPEEPPEEWKEIGDNLIPNGNFDNGLEHWQIHNQGIYEDWAGSADFNVVNGRLKVTINQVGWEWWHIQLYQNSVSVPEGFYKISFDAESQRERHVYVELAGSGAPIQSYNVNSENKNYESIIEVKESGNYKFLFGLGRKGGEPELEVPYDIYIDNVSLVKVVPID